MGIVLSVFRLIIDFFSSHEITNDCFSKCFYLIYITDPITGIPVVTDPLGPSRVPQTINTNFNLMLHEQLFPAASRNASYIISDVKLDRLSRYTY